MQSLEQEPAATKAKRGASRPAARRAEPLSLPLLLALVYP